MSKKRIIAELILCLLILVGTIAFVVKTSYTSGQQVLVPAKPQALPESAL